MATLIKEYVELTNKYNKLISNYQSLQKENKRLQFELNMSKDMNETQQKTIDLLKQKLDVVNGKLEIQFKYPPEIESVVGDNSLHILKSSDTETKQQIQKNEDNIQVEDEHVEIIAESVVQEVVEQVEEPVIPQEVVEIIEHELSERKVEQPVETTEKTPVEETVDESSESDEPEKTEATQQGKKPRKPRKKKQNNNIE